MWKACSGPAWGGFQKLARGPSMRMILTVWASPTSTPRSARACACSTPRSGGLGGCPFAPGATGNVATEDVAWMFERMGVATGIDLDSLVAVAREGASLPGGMPGGRVRDALTARPEACLAPAVP